MSWLAFLLLILHSRHLALLMQRHLLMTTLIRVLIGENGRLILVWADDHEATLTAAVQVGVDV